MENASKALAFVLNRGSGRTATGKSALWKTRPVVGTETAPGQNALAKQGGPVPCVKPKSGTARRIALAMASATTLQAPANAVQTIQEKHATTKHAL